MNKASTKMEKSVKSLNPCLALPRRQAGGRQACKSVIQTNYDIVKMHGGELDLETVDGKGSNFKIVIPQSNN